MPDPARQTADDGFHEIQLTGKQLVFLFMATTVVAVVIFLCGVLVGRGVRTDRVAGDPASARPETQATAPPPASATQSGEPSVASGEDLSYAERLQGEEPKEQLKPGAASGAASTAEPPTPDESAPERPAATEPAAAAPAGATPPSGAQGWVVQVAALRDRAAAVSIIQRLTRRGYQAFIVEPTPGAPAPGYRVRVGPYQDRRQAEQASRRLEREEQFKPFITR
ncbi:MAG TPA: SPOR domain-containing protein [Vicinamibacterales bacterium]|nr:SPOR domain-containing protein [Vicinamibacterales bacterium]